MTDILERLRNGIGMASAIPEGEALMDEAADEIEGLRENSDNLREELKDSLNYAVRLAISLWEKHWKNDAPDWKPLSDLMGVLWQIDNMIVGLYRRDDEELPTAEDVKGTHAQRSP